jgi:hypothetical protein
MTVSTDLRPELRKLVAKTDLSDAEITHALDAMLALLQ